MIKKVVVSLIFCLILFDLSTAQAKSNCQVTWEKILNQHKIKDLYKPLIGLCGDNFRKELWKKIATNRELDYRDARHIMFSYLDNYDGKVCGVYTGLCIYTEGIPDHTIFNTEHSWCQSWGAVGKAKSDLHHLYPTKSEINSKRNNFPFCEVSNVSWRGYGSYFGKSYSNTTCFEPPNNHKGKLARAMFYFSVRYSRPIDSEQENFFRYWHKEYSVTVKEYRRNAKIQYYQGNQNPFILYPEFVNLITDF